MTELKWTRRHEDVIKIQYLEDISSTQKEKHIIILPEDVKMNEAIDFYVNESEFYTEYLHWDSKGVLDGFIDHRKNTFLLNN